MNKPAAFRLIALLPVFWLTACNPFEVNEPDREAASLQRPAASMDIPVSPEGSAQVSTPDQGACRR